MGLNIFDMGIPSYKYSNWKNKRLYGMVLFGDIPQLIIQIMYINVTQFSISIIICMHVHLVYLYPYNIHIPL